MMYVDNPVFKEIIWEWRAFAIKVDPGRAIRDGQQLMSILSQVTPSIQVINVQKRRELHVWPSRDTN